MKLQWILIWGLAGLLAWGSPASGQTNAYVGYIYPAGGQQDSTVQVKVGGQRLDGVHQVLVTGEGVTAKLVKYFRPLNAQESSLIREQLNLLRRATRAPAPGKKAKKTDRATLDLIARIQTRMSEYCNRPACASIASLAWLEVTIAPDAPPGERELRLVTARGVTNPMPFHVGQVPETARKPMLTSKMQVLGKEYLAQRKRPEEEVEVAITLPCTVNGQVAPGEVNWYRFSAKKGQRLVLTTAARQLVPYIADAVPGWFQPVLAVYDAEGNELAYDDDFRFKPDPSLLFEVPEDGEYRFSISDAIFRGREDFVYRVTIGELPFVTSIFPLGGPAGVPTELEVQGWNVDGASVDPPPSDAGPGIHYLTVVKDGMVSNAVPFALDTLPEEFEQEPNDDANRAQQVKLPVILNGRIDAQDDWDVYQFAGRGGDQVVVEVMARRLDSPLDSIVKITSPDGTVLAFNDDHEDVGSGLNTHHADSYVMFELPTDGIYNVHIGDTARAGGPAYGYRLRIGPPRPDFELRTAPSSAAMRVKGAMAVNVYAIRKDGFDGDITIRLKNPPEGFTARPTKLAATKGMVRFAIRTTKTERCDPVRLEIEGVGKVGDREIVRDVVPAEDRMQAFLWRHLVPAQEFIAYVYDPAYQPPSKRELPKPREKAAGDKPKGPAKFSPKQVAGRLRQLEFLYEEGLLSDDFYLDKVEECEASL